MSFFRRIVSRLSTPRRDSLNRVPLNRRRLASFHVEHLEHRTLLSVSSTAPSGQNSALVGGFETLNDFARSGWGSATSYSSPGADGSVGADPTQLKHAYGFDQTSLNGSGETIAIVDFYHDANAYSDLEQFDSFYGIQNPPSFTSLAQDGSMNFQGYLVPGDVITVNGEQETINVEETALDIEWAHALAPNANILLVEANLNPQTQTLGQQDANVFEAINTARNYSGVSVVSMSFGRPEDQSLDTSDNNTLMTPAGHTPVTFVAAAGDAGSPGIYPALSPNVVAVGGTTLSIDGSGDRESETTWNDTHVVDGKDISGATGGGPSSFEAQPSYQSATYSSKYRTFPDISSAADVDLSSTLTGVWTYDSADFGTSTPWSQQWGTSLGAPTWSALTALLDQVRATRGLANLDGPTGMLPEIYSVPASAFSDITTGGNGTYNAGAGYDLVSGRGTEIVGNVLSKFTSTISPSGAAFVNGEQVAEVTDVANSNLQDLFTVGSDGHLREDQFNDSTHSASGQRVVDATTSFPQGARITAYSDGTTINLFGVNSSGEVIWDQQQNGTTISLGTFSTQYSFTPGEAVVAQAQSGALNLFAVATDGYIRQYQYIAGGSNEWYGYTFSHELYMNPGTPLSVWFNGPSGLLDLYGELPDTNVAQWQFSPSSCFGSA